MVTTFRYRLLDQPDDQSVTDCKLTINSAGIVAYPCPFITEIPSGRRDFYLQYMIKGEMIYRLGDCEYVMHPGECMLRRPGTPYYCRSGSIRPEYYWMHFSGTDAAEVVEICGFENERIYRVGVNEGLMLDFETVLSAFDVRDEKLDLFLAQAATRLLVEISRAFEENSQLRPDKRITNIATKMHREYRKIRSIDELAADVRLTPDRLRKLFKARYGVSPNRYLNSIRIENAKRLLKNTSMRISEISEAVGFDDSHYFARSFREAVGCTPSEYRRSLSGM